MAYPEDIRPITVEIEINSVWENISPYFLADTAGTINRGAGSEDNSMPPTNMNLTLNNADGRFTRENPLSPYYPYLRQSTPIRYTIEDNSIDYSRFYGEIAEWPESTLDLPQNSRVEVEAAGLFRRWEKSLPLISPLRRTTIASGNTLVAYWPMEDESENTQVLASGIPGKPAMDIKQAVSVAQYSGFACSEAIPTLGTGQLSGPIAPHSLITPTAPAQYTFEFLYHTSAVAADDTTVAALFFAGGNVSRVSILAHTNGDLRVRVYDHLGAIVVTSSYIGTFTTNNKDVKVVISLLNSSTNLIYALSTLVEGDRVTVPSVGGTFGTPANVGIATYAVFGLFNNAAVSVGHATIWTGQPANYTDVTYSFHAYTEERAGTRAQRIAKENNVPIHLIGDPALTPRMGPQPRGTIKDVLEQCPEVDHSLLYESREELGIVFLMRNSLYNQSSGTRIGPDMAVLSAGTTTTAVLSLTYKDYWRVGEKFQLRLISDDSLVEATVFTVTGRVEGSSSLTLTFSPAAAASTGTTKELARVRVGLLALSYADHELQPPARPVHDDRLTANSIEVTRTEGSSFLAQQDTGPRSIQDPPNGIGIQPDTARLNIYTDGELAEHAYWLLNLGLNADARWPSMELGLHSSALVSRQAAVLGLDIGHRVTISEMEHARIYATQHQLTRGYTETFDGNRLHYISLNGVPEGNYHILQFDNAACRWAAANTTLGEDVTTTQTGLIKMSSTDNWTTSAGDYPQNITVGGEDWTITGNSGSVTLPSFVGIGTSSTGNNASVTPGLPAGATSGDVVYILASIRTETAIVNTPASWTRVDGINTHFKIFRRVYDGVWTMPTVTFSGGASGDTTLGQSAAFRNLGNNGAAPYTNISGATSGQQDIPDASHRNVASKIYLGQTGLRLFAGHKADDWSSVAYSGGWTVMESLSSTTGNDAAQTWAYRIDNGDFVTDLITVTGGAVNEVSSIGCFIPGGPQTFTVSARSVNGVVKEHTAGAEVQIIDKFYYGL